LIYRWEQRSGGNRNEPGEQCVLDHVLSALIFPNRQLKDFRPQSFFHDSLTSASY
jgi:hypothetical protein